MKAVEVENVTYSYNSHTAVEDVTLSVEEGEFLGLVGPNGSGKTTLLKLILGLLKPDSGEVSVFGEPTDEFDDGERIGYVSQSASEKRNMPVTVREVVRMGRFPSLGFSLFGDDDARAAEEALRKVGVDDLADRRVSRLSGGQKQRVFIARALASGADLLALDEPAVGVDAESRDNFYGMLDDLNEDGITVLLIEHDIGVVTEHADTVACLNRRLFHHGAPDEFVESDALEQAYGTTQAVLHHDH